MKGTRLGTLLPRLLVLALAALAAFAPGALLAQDPAATQKIGVVIGGPGRNVTPIAVPRPNGNAADRGEFYEVLKRDLAITGWFDLIDPAAYVEPVGTGLRPGEFRYEDWEITGAVALGKTSLADEGGKLRAEVWVYDVPGRRKLGAKAFSADAKGVRTLAHKVANEVIYLVTGQQGPFNTRFAFSAAFSGNKEIYVCDFDGFGVTRITKNGSINIQPSWDRSGRRLLFTSFITGNPDLYVADLGQGRITRLSSRSGINSGGMFHPLANLVALTLSPGGDPEIVTIDGTSGAQVARLTKSTGIDVSPAWSPDGSQIAFVSERSGGAQIYVMAADGSGVRRVTFQGAHNTDPAWSPDGKQIAFVSRDGVFDVFTVRVDGTGMTRITQAAGDNEDPSWSPDGNYIAYSSTRTGSAHIWASTADGSREMQLTTGKGGYTNPSWSPALTW